MNRDLKSCMGLETAVWVWSHFSMEGAIQYVFKNQPSDTCTIIVLKINLVYILYDTAFVKWP